MQILITGGAGFIGSYLTELLLAQGDTVWAVDDLSTGSIDNIEHLKSHPRYHYQIESVMRQDLSDWPGSPGSDDAPVMMTSCGRRRTAPCPYG